MHKKDDRQTDRRTDRLKNYIYRFLVIIKKAIKESIYIIFKPVCPSVFFFVHKLQAIYILEAYT